MVCKFFILFFLIYVFQVQEYKSVQENLDDELVELKNTITKMEKMSQLKEQNFQGI